MDAVCRPGWQGPPDRGGLSDRLRSFLPPLVGQSSRLQARTAGVRLQWLFGRKRTGALTMTNPQSVFRVRQSSLERAQEWSIRVTACATVALAPLDGYLHATSPQLAKVPAILLTGAWAFARLSQRRWPSLHNAHILLAALAVVVLLSAALHISDQFTTAYVIRWLPFLLITGILVDVVSREVDVQLLLASVVAGAALASAGALYSFIVLGDTRATGPLEDPNDLAFVLVGAFPLILAPAFRLGRAVKLGTAAISALMIIGIASTFSRGGAFALIAALLWLYLRGTLNPKVLATSLVTVVAAGTVAAFTVRPLLVRAFFEKDYIAQSNVDSRLASWQAACRMIAEHPILGVGPGSFQTEYSRTSRIGELGLAAVANPAAGVSSPVAHNMYLEVAAELGVIGFLLFVGIIATSFVSSERSLRMGMDRSTVGAIQASLLAMLVAAIFLSEQYYLSMWAVIAIACGMQLRAAKGGS
jgi:putative inorganic carbon (HCO3(-)) transporter